MKISATFGLGKTQSELDFVDVDTSRDTRLFIDPYAIEIRDDQLSIELKGYISSYFDVLLESIRGGGTGISLTSHLSEPEETFLGVSKGAPAGRGIGEKQARAIVSALRRSQAFKSGEMNDLAETELFIEGISSDKLSDLTTNIIRIPLERYTKSQCDLLGIPTKNVAMPAAWNPTSGRWEAHYAEVPIVGNKRVLFVPKILVRRKLSLDSQEFYNNYMLEYLQEEEIKKGGSLVRILKTSKRPVVYKKDLKERRPFSKPDLEKFVKDHPTVLETYRKIKGAMGTLTARDFDEEFDERSYAQALKIELVKIPPGSEHASAYHTFMIGVLSFLLFPHLSSPVKEHEQHDGRKRVDIRYTNTSKDGFFYRMRTWPPAAANYVFVECKNYSSDVGNPELDQLSGRFGHQKGNLGILVCRAISDQAKFTRSCRDTAGDGRGFIIGLDDNAVCQMLDSVADWRRSAVGNVLEGKLSAITS